MINNQGSVGIGTESPGAKLHVGGTPGVDGIMFPDGTVQTTAATASGDGDWTILGDDMSSAVSGNVGIGSTSPAAKLHLQDGSVLFAGTTGTTPASGAGTRMMWIPEKKAFRAGEVEGTRWDAENVGNLSFAVGYDAMASGENSTALGWGPIASGTQSIALGQRAIASGIQSFALGANAEASGPGSIAIGQGTKSSGQFATALGESTIASSYNTTALGWHTTASGWASTAMGSFASTNSHAGSFVYGDKSTQTEMTATADNQFMVRAAGGYVFYTNSATTLGAKLEPNATSWTVISDRHKKENFKSIDGEKVLQSIRDMPITSWNYKDDDKKSRHYGPMAQDFYAAFGLGNDALGITTQDISGVNMAAIQALEKRTDELKEVTAQLKAKDAELEAKMDELKMVQAELTEMKAKNEQLQRNQELLNAKMLQLEAALRKIGALK
ncbi:tail fiber domain-containing protein [bacterium]|nr:tail fiber domain-containing protein [bacterium]